MKNCNKNMLYGGIFILILILYISSKSEMMSAKQFASKACQRYTYCLDSSKNDIYGKRANIPSHFSCNLGLRRKKDAPV